MIRGSFVNLLDATRARLLERAPHVAQGIFCAAGSPPGLNVLDVGCGTGDFIRLLAPIVSPGTAVGVDAKHGADPMIMTQPEFARFVVSESERRGPYYQSYRNQTSRRSVSKTRVLCC